MNEREAFEAEYSKGDFGIAGCDLSKHADGSYINDDAFSAFFWFKAGLARANVNEQSQAQQSQAARLLLLKLEIEHICDDVKYAKDAKLAIQKLDFSKAASQAQQDDICPDCGRKKAKSADDCAAGLCPKWYAIRDKEAAKDCQTVSQAQQESLQIGEMRENGVNWYGKNPHAFPVGTKFFALPPAPVSDNEQPEGE